MGRRLIGALVLAGALAASAQAATSPVKGTYATKLANTSSALLNAIWDVQINADGHYVIYRDGKAVVTGLSLTKKDEIGFADERGSAACLGKNSAGYYRWGFAKHAGYRYLILRVERDPCTGREAVLATYPLVKVK